MSVSARELFASYPFLPGSGVDPAVRNIRDVHIEYTIPASEPASLSQSIDGIKATLVSVSQAALVISLQLQEYGVSTTISVPVYVGIDSVPAVSSSATRNYAIVAEAVTATSLTRTYRLHPDCLVLRQALPTLSVDYRSGYSIVRDTDPTQTGTHQMSELKFESGNNVDVTYDGSTLTIAGGDGNGAGQWSGYPFTEFSAYPHRNATGLRSICGRSGDVSIRAKGSDITVSTVYDSANHKTKVTIGHSL